MFYWTYAWLDCSVDDLIFFYVNPQSDGEGKKYYSFELPEGETMDFTMKYLIDREYLNVDTPFLAIAPGRVPQAGILLDNIQEE